MSHILSNFRNKIQANFSDSSRFLIAVSGGADSIFLVEMFCQVLDVEQLRIAHYDHGTRDGDSSQDEEFVRQYAESKKITYLFKRAPQELSLVNSNFEEQARNFRYSWLQSVLEDETLCTGHNLNDQIETLILNMHRGCGLNGLKGIECLSELFSMPVFRPLLDVSKQEIYSYLIQHGISWREDSTNVKNLYRRNLIRNKLMDMVSLSLLYKIVQIQLLSKSLLVKLGNETFDMIDMKYGIEIDLDYFISLSPFKLKSLIDFVFAKNQCYTGPSKKQMTRLSDFLYSDQFKMELSHGVAVRKSKRKIFFSNIELEYLPFKSSLGGAFFENEYWKISIQKTEFNEKSSFSEIESSLQKMEYCFFIDNISDINIKYILQAKVLKEKSIIKRVKNLKIEPWRRYMLPALMTGDEIIVAPYLGVQDRFYVTSTCRCFYKVFFEEKLLINSVATK